MNAVAASIRHPAHNACAKSTSTFSGGTRISGSGRRAHRSHRACTALPAMIAHFIAETSREQRNEWLDRAFVRGADRVIRTQMHDDEGRQIGS